MYAKNPPTQPHRHNMTVLTFLLNDGSLVVLTAVQQRTNDGNARAVHRGSMLIVKKLAKLQQTTQRY